MAERSPGMMMREGIRFSILTDDGNALDLCVEASADGFSGVASAWVSKEALEAFARALDVFPIPVDAPPTLLGGRWAIPAHAIHQVLLSVAVCPTNNRGALAAVAELRPDLRWQRASPEIRPFANVVVDTDYAAVQRFARDIPRLVHGEIAEAVLEPAR